MQSLFSAFFIEASGLNVLLHNSCLTTPTFKRNINTVKKKVKTVIYLENHISKKEMDTQNAKYFLSPCPR
jgi:hypothetical protein